MFIHNVLSLHTFRIPVHYSVLLILFSVHCSILLLLISFLCTILLVLSFSIPFYSYSLSVFLLTFTCFDCSFVLLSGKPCGQPLVVSLYLFSTFISLYFFTRFSFIVLFYSISFHCSIILILFSFHCTFLLILISVHCAFLLS
jgi:hypothetical protein